MSAVSTVKWQPILFLSGFEWQCNKHSFNERQNGGERKVQNGGERKVQKILTSCDQRKEVRDDKPFFRWHWPILSSLTLLSSTVHYLECSQMIIFFQLRQIDAVDNFVRHVHVQEVHHVHFFQNLSFHCCEWKAHHSSQIRNLSTKLDCRACGG